MLLCVFVWLELWTFVILCSIFLQVTSMYGFSTWERIVAVHAIELSAT